MASILLLPTPIVDLLMFVYPAYCSAAALKEHDREKIIQFMTYWIVFAAFVTVDSFLFFFLKYVQVYTVARRAICIWCVLPITNNGGKIIYNKVIEALFLEVTEEVNNLPELSLQQITRTAEQITSKVTGRFTQVADTSQPVHALASVDAPGPALNGLEQLRDNAEAYRDRVMDQLLSSLGGVQREMQSDSSRSILKVQQQLPQRSARLRSARARRTRSRASRRSRGSRRRGDSEGEGSADDSATGEDVTWTQSSNSRASRRAPAFRDNKRTRWQVSFTTHKKPQFIK